MNKGNKNIFDETVETLTKDAKALTERYNKYVSAEADPDNCVFRNKMTIDTLRLLKDTLSLIKEYDWHLEYSEYETDNHKEIAVWEQNYSGEIRNKKSWFVCEPVIYIDYGRDETLVYVDGRMYVYDLKHEEKKFIDLIKCYKNYKIYACNYGSSKFVSDLLYKHGIETSPLVR